MLRQFSQVGRQALAFYENKDDWGFVRRSLPKRSRVEGALALKAIALVAHTMSESLQPEEKGDEEDEPPRGSNDGLQR